MAYGIPERAAMIALMALNKETPNAELKRRYGIDVKKPIRDKLNQDGLLQSRRLGGAKGFAHELTDAGWAWAAAELDAGVPPRARSAGGALYALLNGLKVALDARGMVIQELFAPAAPGPVGSLRDRIREAYHSLVPRPWDWVELRDLRAQLGDWLAARWTWSSSGCSARRTSISRCTKTAAGSRRPTGTRRFGSAWTTAPDQHGVRAVEPELKALGQVAFSTVHAGNDIWRDDVIHVDGIHSWAFDRTMETLARVRDGVRVNNLLIQGRPGIGKSHFLGRVRHAVIEQGQIFVLFQPSTARQFWDSLALAYVDSLHRKVGEGGTQLHTVLQGLGVAIGLKGTEIESVVAGTFDLTHLKVVRRNLQGYLGHQPADRVALDVALALILTNSEDFAHQDIGYALLQGLEVDVDEARAHSIRAGQIPCRDVVGAFDRLTGTAGLATLVAVDQLDGLVALGRSLEGAEEQLLLDQVATGLMDLAEDVQHSLIAVSCLTASWMLIRERAVESAHDRYPAVVQLREIPSVEVGEALIAAYLRTAYARAGFTPKYPTWPVRPAAFADAPLFSPRSLINLVQEHCERCRERGRVTEVAQLPNERQGPEPLPDGPRPGGDPPPPEPPPDPGLDQRFSRLVREANVADALDEKKVDYGLPPLLRAGLTAWAEENAAAGDFSVDRRSGETPRFMRGSGG